MELAERIIGNLRYGIKTKTSQSILSHIINALNGDKIHFFSAWHRRGGWSNLNVVPQAHDAYELMQDQFESKTQVSYTSLDKAKEALDIAVNTQKGSIQAALRGNTYKFTISYILYNAKGAAVYKIDLKIDGENLTIVK